MKKYGIFKVLLLMLALLLTVSTVASCALPLLSGGAEEEETTTTDDPVNVPTEPSGPTVPSEPSGPSNPSTPPSETRYTVNVKNGSIYGGVTNFVENAAITVEAVTPPNGYVFTHWENSAGEKVSEEASFDYVVTKNETFKAFFEPTITKSFSAQILTDLENDWQQGGINTTYNTIEIESKAPRHRVIFQKPLLLKAGSTLTVSLPDFQCRVGTPDCSETTCSEGGKCGLTGALLYLEKKVEGESDSLNDYTVKNYPWLRGTSSVTVTEDTYVALCVKSTAHGGTIAFNINTPTEYGGDVSAMSQVKILYSEPKAEGPTALGAYWADELTDAIGRIDEIRESASSYLSEFFFITDTHWIQNAQASPALINYMSEQLGVNNVVFGGDLIYRYNASKDSAINDEINSFYAAFTDFCKNGENLRIFSMLGNHDRNGSSNQPDASMRLTEEEAYDLYLKRMEGWAVTEAGNPNHAYYDDTVNKVRYVQFYFAGGQWGMTEDANTPTSLAWATEKIMELDETWTVVLFTHGFFCGTEGSQTEITEESAKMEQAILKLKSESRADIAAWITGHNHEDRAKVLQMTNPETGELVTELLLLSFNADAYTHSSGYKMSLGTVTEQCFSFIQVDALNKVIYVTGVGAAEDMTFSYAKADTVIPEDDGNGSNKDDGKSTVRVLNGTFEGGTTVERVENGSEVTMTVGRIPEGFRFKHWTNRAGDVLGTDNTLTVTASASETYIAVLEQIPEVVIQLQNGTLEGGLESGRFLAGSEITIIAKDAADAGLDPKFWCFSHWVNQNGEILGETATLTAKVSEENDVWTAIYKNVPRHTVTVVNGTIAGQGYTLQIYDAGETATITANAPATGMVFVGWQDANQEIVSTDATFSFTVTDDVIYTAVYGSATN
jgi:hypothetical protein